MNRDDLVERLTSLDDYLLSGGCQETELIVVGGAALMLGGMVPASRVTQDIDIVNAPAQVMEFAPSQDINDDADTFFYYLPQGWRERSIEVPLDLCLLRVLIPSPCDLAVMKLLSGRPQDISDLRLMVCNGTLDLSALMQIIANPLEVQANVSPTEFATILERMKGLEERFDERDRVRAVDLGANQGHVRAFNGRTRR